MSAAQSGPLASEAERCPCPRLLADFVPPPGVIKSRPGDFRVEELPLYPAGGDGTHTYLEIEKTGLATPQAIQRIANALGVERRDIGYAGLKDSIAVTRQWLSIEHVPPERVAPLAWPDLRVLQVARHTNKLKLGHLYGNRFELRVREFPAERFKDLQAAFERLQRVGVPNYFGPQRFGIRGDGWLVGRAIVRDDLAGALDQWLGKPGPIDHGDILKARAAYEAGDFVTAGRSWPMSFRAELRALTMLKRNGSKKRAFLSIHPNMRSFYVAAYQSELFNRVLARRVDRLAALLPGDLAWRHANGAVFRVLDPAVEQPRADAFEISPSGPLFGYRMSEPDGDPGSLEAEILAAEGLTPEDLRAPRLRIKGARRPLRFPLEAGAVQLADDEHGPYLSLQFVLPRGCYATTVSRELLDAKPVADDSPAE